VGSFEFLKEAFARAVHDAMLIRLDAAASYNPETRSASLGGILSAGRAAVSLPVLTRSL
jgi:hypothetical protein